MNGLIACLLGPSPSACSSPTHLQLQVYRKYPALGLQRGPCLPEEPAQAERPTPAISAPDLALTYSGLTRSLELSCWDCFRDLEAVYDREKIGGKVAWVVDFWGVGRLCSCSLQLSRVKCYSHAAWLVGVTGI